MPSDIERQYEFYERARIMEFDGKLHQAVAERLARERPWEKEPRWGLPKLEPAQLTLEETEGDRIFRHLIERYG